MTEPNFRALCAELVELDQAEPSDYANPDVLRDWRQNWNAAIDRARTALEAQPEPQGPSETAWALAQLLDGVQRHDLPNMTGLSDSDCDRIWAARPAIEPVPQQDDVHYAWELHDAEGEWQAGGSANSLEDVQREGNRYLQTYSQDGPHKLIIERHYVTTIEPVPGVEVE